MRLTFTGGDFNGRTVVVKKSPYRIGRADENDLRIPDSDASASRQHAELVQIDGRWAIRDLGSANGVRIDGHRIDSQTQLRDGQSVRVGAQQFKVSIPATARRPKTEPDGGSSNRKRSYTTLLMETNRRVKMVAVGAAAAVLVAVSVAVAAVTGVFSSGNEHALNVPAVARTAKPSTMLIETKVGGKPFAGGSGWVLDAARGLVVTNAHVVTDAQSVTVATPRGRPRPARIVGVNACEDVALLRTSDTHGLRTLPRIRPGSLSQGDPVVALGFPASLSPDDNLVTTTGVVSVVKTRAEEGDYPNVVQTDAAINHGNSGGPLLNADGELVGMNTLGGFSLGQENENFAIAADHISSLLPALEKRQSRGYLGISLLGSSDADNPDMPVAEAADGTKYYGMLVAGPADGVTAPDGLLGSATLPHYVYGIDGKLFGPSDGTDTIPQTATEDGLCNLIGPKRSGEATKLDVLEIDDANNALRFRNVTVRYR